MRARLHDARVEAHGRGVDHVATLTFAPGTLPPCDVRIGVDRAELVPEAPSLVPFVPAAMVLASRLGQDLCVEEPLPPALHEGARAVTSRLSSWHGWRPAELIAPLGVEAERPSFLPRRGGVGLFFTRGIDSWSTLLELRAGPRRHRPTHLITVDTEVHHAAEIRRAHLERTAAVADRLGLPSIVVRTDIRSTLDPHLDWGTMVHGAVFAGIGLLLRRTLREVVISPTHWTPLLRPWGSHPDLDPAWSIPGLRIVHHPGDAPRWQRVERVARDDLAVRSIQVCWQGTSLQNCGRCEKCLRLMTSLTAVGAMEAASETFDIPFDPALITPALHVDPHPWCDTIDHLDHVGLAVDALRQRWEQVPRRGIPGVAYQDRPIQPRVPVDARSAHEAAQQALARRLAALGARIDHEADPTAPAALVLAADRPDAVSVRLGAEVGGPRPIGTLDVADLDDVLRALGCSRRELVPFDPDGQAPPPVRVGRREPGPDPAPSDQGAR